MFGITFYFVMIIYAIWKRKMMDISGHSDEEKKFCDNLVVGWIRFEIRIFMFSLISCAIFLAIFNIFKCRSKFKKLQEDLRLETIW